MRCHRVSFKNTFAMKACGLVAVALLQIAAAQAPSGYRTWTHKKSALKATLQGIDLFERG